MVFENNVIKDMMDDLNLGVMLIDNECKIQMINDCAKDFTGININNYIEHDKGKIEEGDIVIIADNCLGEDDGGLTSKDLNLINIYDSNIRKGDMVIAIGVYKNSEVAPDYKYASDNSFGVPFTLQTNYFGINIQAEINHDESYIDINVNGDSCKIDYYYSIGHMVVLSSKTGKIKFCQAKGYSTRKEDTAFILRGGEFKAKGTSDLDDNIIGQEYLNIFDKSELSDKILNVLNGSGEVEIKQFYEINKRPFLCSIMPFKVDEKILGVFLIFEDISMVEDMLEERNGIMSLIESKQKDAKKLKVSDLPDNSFDSYVGVSSKSRQVKYLAYKAAGNNFNVIITGESGTGKTRLASEIHKIYKPESPFVVVNCNAISPSLFESELFGYVGGAFTGAKSNGKVGYFEQADGGTLFLDEIGEIPLDIQVKFLNVLEDKVIYKVGSSTPVKVDVRIIAATNRNLEEEVEAGRFRRDLYYRLNVFPIEISPIRERKADLYVMINQILEKTCEKYGFEQKYFSGNALQKLINYDWPGNIRELENVIERAVIICESKIIYPEFLKISSHDSPLTMKKRLEIEEKRILENVLFKYTGDKVKAIEELKISKSVFYEKLKKYNINL